MAQPFSISDEDRREALIKAAAVRRERAELRDQLKAGDISLSDLFGRLDDDTVGKMKVLVVIESLPGVGKVKARRAMEGIGISESRRMRGLGSRQRSRLLDAFG
ncbi:MAG: integration host factor, actinobacterial type [Acidimicrobiaceae bacterium]|nr:integration host factor, actinobacterial type [Acidimicrobiaceae bacterium]